MIWQIILPVYSEVRERQEILNGKEAELQKLEEMTDKMNELINVYRERETEIEKVWQILPEEKDVPGLISQFEFLAVQSGLILDSVDFSEVEEIAKSPEETEEVELPYKTLSVTIKVTGSYDTFKNFLFSLENNLRLIDVSSINFATKGEVSDIFDFSLSGNVYYQ